LGAEPRASVRRLHLQLVVGFLVAAGCSSGRPPPSTGAGGTAGSGAGGTAGSDAGGTAGSDAGGALGSDATDAPPEAPGRADAAPDEGPGDVAPVHCYDVAADFEPAGSNPHGVWLYGWASDGNSPFTRYARFGNALPGVAGSDALDFWYDGSAPTVVYNPTALDDHLNNSITLQRGQFALHPGPAGELSIARWTAPDAGRYAITATFLGISGYLGAPLTTTDVHVRRNGADLPDAAGYINVNGSGNVTRFTLTVDVVAGDTIDFAVGRGNGVYTNDSTALAAALCK